MSRSTFKVLFYLKRQNEKNGKVPVMGRITVNGTIAQFSCKLNIRPALWDTKANKAAGKSVEAQRINERLENIKTNIGKQYQRICDRDSYVTAEKVKNAWLGFGDGYQLLMQTFDEYLTAFEKRVGKDRAPSTLKNYRDARRHLATFLEREYHMTDIPFNELKREFIEKYVIFLLNDQNLRSGSALISIKKLRLMTYTAFKNGWIPTDPFAGFRVAPQYRDRRFLSESELNAVINVHLPNYKTGINRDIFVFCCFTGLSHIDMAKLTHDDIFKTPDGEQWITGNREKTGTQYSVKLLPVARQMIAKYSRLKLPGGVIFPAKGCKVVDKSLRHVAKLAGLSFNPTMHTARHTFATTVTLSQGVPLETVSQMLGHTNILTTQIYAKITNEKISRDMDALTLKIGDKFKIAQ